MEARGPLVVLATLLLASTGGAQSPSPPEPKRLGRPVLQAPGAEERQTATPKAGQGPGGAEQAGPQRLGRRVLTAPPRGVRGTTAQGMPARSGSAPRQQPSGGAAGEGQHP